MTLAGDRYWHYIDVSMHELEIPPYPAPSVSIMDELNHLAAYYHLTRIDGVWTAISHRKGVAAWPLSLTDQHVAVLVDAGELIPISSPAHPVYARAICIRQES